MSGFNTIGEMTRGDAYFLIRKIYENKKILVHRYDLYQILLQQYVSEGGMKSFLSKKQIYNFMGDVVKALKSDPDIKFDSNRNAGTSCKGALYLLDLRDASLWNDNSSPLLVTCDDELCNINKSSSPSEMSSLHQKKSSENNPALNNSSISVLDDSVLPTLEKNDKNNSVYFYSFPKYIENPDNKGRYFIAISTAKNEAPMLSLNKQIRCSSLEWPKIIKIIYCNAPKKLETLFKDYFHDQLVASPGKNSFNISPNEINNAYTDIINSILSKHGI